MSDNVDEETRGDVIEAYGYKIGFRYQQMEVRKCLDEITLHSWKRCSADAADAWLTVTSTENGYELLDDGKPWTAVAAGNLELLRHRLQQLIQIRLTAGARGFAFVHAGVVLCKSGLVVIAGPSKTGKSSLVKEMCLRGARFYSDEFAVINPQGLVEPYPRDLWSRISKKERRPESAASLGWSADLGPAPISLLLFAPYKPGSAWQPTCLTADEAARLLGENAKLSDTAGVQLELLEQACQCCTRLSGIRGDSNAFIEQLTRWLGPKL